MTVNQWIDENINVLYNRKLRLLDNATHMSYSDKLLACMGAKVQATKITNKFVFIFI